MSMTGPGCTACGFERSVPFDRTSPGSLIPCPMCSPWTRPAEGGPPTSEDFARAMYPALRALLVPRCEAAGDPMPAAFDDVPEADREQFVEMVRVQMAAAHKAHHAPTLTVNVNTLDEADIAAVFRRAAERGADPHRSPR